MCILGKGIILKPNKTYSKIICKEELNQSEARKSNGSINYKWEIKLRRLFVLEKYFFSYDDQKRELEAKEERNIKKKVEG